MLYCFDKKFFVPSYCGNSFLWVGYNICLFKRNIWFLKVFLLSCIKFNEIKNWLRTYMTVIYSMQKWYILWISAFWSGSYSAVLEFYYFLWNTSNWPLTDFGGTYIVRISSTVSLSLSLSLSTLILSYQS